jgi:hypothetical protein
MGGIALIGIDVGLNVATPDGAATRSLPASSFATGFASHIDSAEDRNKLWLIADARSRCWNVLPGQPDRGRDRDPSCGAGAQYPGARLT